MQFEAIVEGLGPKGHGLVRGERGLLFVPDTLPGERVLLEGEGRHPRLVRILEPSSGRRASPCPHDHPGGCGGCELLGASFATSAGAKVGMLRALLARAGVVQPPIEDPVLPGNGLGYRNRARFGVDREGRLTYVRRAEAGKRAGRGRIAVDRCPVLLPELETIRELLDGNCAGFEEVELRAARRGAEILVIGSGPRLPSALDPGTFPVSLLWRRPQGLVPLRGQPWLEEEVRGIRLRVGAESFFQGNHEGAARLVDLVSEMVGELEGCLAWDLYAGVGLFALTALAGAKEVLAVESAPSACADLRENARRAPRVQVRGEEVGAALPDLLRFGGAVDVVVADPPREGLGEEVADALARCAPDRLVLVSCDPSACARDIARLGKGGMRPERMVPVDQFGGTRHLECVSLLRGRVR